MSKKEEVKEMDKNEESKGKKIFKEFLAFIIIVLIIGGISYGGYYWYKNYYNPNKNVKNNVKEDDSNYNVEMATDELRYLKLNDEYIYGYSAGIVQEESNAICVIKNEDNENIYDGKICFALVYEGIDGNIYGVNIQEAENENYIKLYKYNNGEFNVLKTFGESGVEFLPIVYEKDDTKYLVGVEGKVVSEDSTIGHEYLYFLGSNDIIESTNTNVIFDYVLDGSDEVTTYNSEYLVIKKDNDKYSLYNYKNKSEVENIEYDELKILKDNYYVAKKDNKYGLIDVNNKVILNFEYDKIDKNILVKDNKVAIMDDNYNLLTNFELPYYSDESYSMSIEKVNNNYILNYYANIESNESYSYIIDNSGKYKKENFIYNEDNFLYAIKDNNLIVYNDNIEEKYKIKVGSNKFYPFKDGDNIIIELYDSNEDVTETLLYKYEDGTEIDEFISYEKEINEDIKVVYYGKKIEVYVENKKVGTIESTPAINGSEYGMDLNIYEIGDLIYIGTSDRYSSGDTSIFITKK